MNRKGDVQYTYTCLVTRRRRDGKWNPATPGSRVLIDYPVSKTASFIESFFLAATLYPEIVRLAREELDQVTRRDRLPEFSDKPQLPYISAIVKEIFRWRTPVPLGTVLF